MSHSVFDLTQPGTRLPERIGLDANVLVTRFIAPSVVTPGYVVRRAQVRTFFRQLRTQGSVGLVPFTAFAEFIHVAIKLRCKADLQRYSHEIGGKKHWELLFKARPDLLEGYARGFGSFLRGFTSLGLVVIQPGDLTASPSVQRVERQLLDLVGGIRLDTHDAAILLELSRAGLDAIVTEDPDLRRAATDFDVYTWL